MSLYGNNNYGFYKINDDGIYYVKLKIQINQSKNNNGYGMYFGVTESDCNICYNKYIRHRKGNKENEKTQKMWHQTNGNKTTHTIIDVFVCEGHTGNIINGTVISEVYGNQWGYNKGDIVECELNLKKMTVSYIVNHANEGIAFKLNKDKTYHFIFALSHKNDSFTVISETIKKISMPSLVLF